MIADWVRRRFPKDDWALARFDGTALYEHVDPRKGEHDWGTLVFNYGRHEVRNFLIANALYWMEEFRSTCGSSAVASMLYLDYSRPAGAWVPNEHGGRENLEAIEFLRQLNTTVFAGATEHGDDRRRNFVARCQPPVHHGGLGFSHKWNMGWMHDTLGFAAHDPVHRRWHHRDLTFGLLRAQRAVRAPRMTVSCTGKVHFSTRCRATSGGASPTSALFGWMWAYPGDPMLFMGGEIAVGRVERDHEGWTGPRSRRAPPSQGSCGR